MAALTEPTEPTRLAFCITELDPGGAERALVQLVTRLDRSRWEPFVFCLAERGPLADELEQAGIPVRCLGARSPRNVLTIVRTISRLTRALRQFQPAVLQTFLFHANIAGRIAGRLAGVKVIVSAIRVAEKRSRRPLWLDRLTQWMVTRNVCVSQGVADFSIAHGGLRPEKVVVIPNGIDAERFRTARPADLNEFGIPPGSRVLLSVGRLDPQKGPFILLEAVKGLLSAYGDLHLLMVGDGTLEAALREWMNRHGLESRIHFAGRRNDVPELMAAADCFVLASLWEGMPNVVLEAMAAGLPIVATAVEGVRELIDSHKTGLLVPPDSSPALAGGIALVLADPEESLRMGKAAQQSVAKGFTLDAVVRNFEALYWELLEEHRFSRPMKKK